MPQEIDRPSQTQLTCDELLTTVTEVEAIVISRPFSFISSEEPLTISQLLIGRRALSLPNNLFHNGDEDDDDAEINPSIFSRQATEIYILNRFWKRWRISTYSSFVIASATVLVIVLHVSKLQSVI